MGDVNLSVNVGGLQLHSPVIAASGTFGFGHEFEPYADLNRLGGISVKGLTLKPRQGNPAPRIAETAGGILNSVGLQNPGVEVFIAKEIPYLRQFKTKIIANLAGSCEDDYVQAAALLNEADVDAVELNVSCPNVKAGCAAFGQDPVALEGLVKAVRKVLPSKPLIIKLTPNVTSIVETARAAVSGGADAVSLINTLLGMKIDAKRMRPVLANVTGGMSGPCVKPVALRMVYEVSKAVDVPIIGMGGIETGEDAAEFILAGATAVQVGTANLVHPNAVTKVEDELIQYMQDMNFTSIADFRGKLQVG